MILLIKKYRNKKNISLRNLSKLTGLTNGYLSKLECNKKNPSLNTIEVIGHALEMCPIRLLGGCYKHICTKECYYYYENYYDLPYNLPHEAKKEIDEFFKYIRNKYYFRSDTL